MLRIRLGYAPNRERFVTTKNLHNEVWKAGHRARSLAKRIGLLGSLEPLLLRLAPRLVRPSPFEMEIELPIGLRMMVPPGFPSARSYASGVYEPELTRLFQNTLRQGMTVVDLGASIGYYTVLASHLVGESGCVYAFEPDPRNYGFLLRNISTSALPNVHAVEKAAADRTGTSAFVPDEGGAEGWLAKAETIPDQITVLTTTLDEFFMAEGWPTVNVIKMDIEGAEKAALDGMEELIRRNRGLILIMEFNRGALERAGTTPEVLADVLTGLGYRRGRILERGMKPFSLPDEMPRSRATYNLLLEPGGAET